MVVELSEMCGCEGKAIMKKYESIESLIQRPQKKVTPVFLLGKTYAEYIVGFAPTIRGDTSKTKAILLMKKVFGGVIKKVVGYRLG